MSELLNKTLSQIVTDNYQAAYVFEKYGLDFCCKGKRPLADACIEKKVNTNALLSELNIALSTKTGGEQFNNMSLTELAEYIVRVHHNYVKQNAPQIFAYVTKVATKHGDRFPYMVEVYRLFAEVQEEMAQHMMKEEKILFPRIKQLEFFEKPQGSIDYLEAPIEVMEHEHDHAGSLMQQIRNLSNNYTAPDDACTTHRLTIAALKGFEEDLHQHVHLENNILFPKAIEKFKLLNEAANCSISM
jgi:regulator of cell morphogenesis and NO signaling